ncbi:MAG: NAD(P)H dehydrogenase [Burkholderiales bacterium RIFCSPHIGHO2_01_FULL_63_240]|jgi:NAD(P)H dehydrogenase (quinone)|nr:MAG: NAD(P)H dehydrogenase [Burkholderiales bacterium RIFCSPHIGHO2_01_FULL_63_240]
MKLLIVHAHNEPQSFVTSMKDLTVRHFEQAGWEVQVSDLYAMGFNPVASAADFGARQNPDYLTYALEQRHGWQNKTLAPDIVAEVEKVQWADLIIFSFPIYWYSMPAILKGWVDRVFISGVCYGGTRIYDRGGLKGKRAMLATSVGGQTHMFGPGAIHGELDTLLKPILQGVLGYVGLTVLPPFVAHHVPYLKAPEREAIMQAYQSRLDQLDALEPLKMPSLADYDATLHPLSQAAG